MRLVVLFTIIFLGQISFSQGLKNIEIGRWKGELAMNDRLFIPFLIDFVNSGNKIQMEIVNADERISMNISNQQDSVQANFPEVDAYLKFKLAENKREIRGYWVNLNKKVITKIPFNAWLNNELIEMAPNTSNISGIENSLNPIDFINKG